MTNATPTTAASPRILMFIIALILIAGGVLLLQFAYGDFQRYRALNQWPSTTGTIIISDVIGERAFRPNLVYTYEVAGQVYRDSSDLNMPSFGGRNNRRSAAETMAGMYPVGSTVVIHYQPEDPANSRLRVSPPWSVYGQMGFGGVLLLLGLFVTGWYLRRRLSVSSKS